MTDISNKTLAEIVMADNHAAPVLQKFKLDYCCKGKRTLETACAENDLSLPPVLEELNKVLDEDDFGSIMPFNEMSAEQLISHILTHHHFFVRRAIPQISMHLAKLVEKHGDHFEWVREGYDIFMVLQEE